MSTLKKAPVPKEYNILLVGETGVGKSTFVNSFVNYMSYNTLDIASKSNIISLIPSSFSVTDDEYRVHKVTLGTDANESTAVGQSSTQSAKAYRISVGNVFFRLIDTPGIGDTRGISKDEENFDTVLDMIGELDELHAICILLKPNNARLNILFQYCIKQLLSRLQKSASQNIIFIFTNSRSTFYRPGDTLPPLLEILKDIELNPPNVSIPFGRSNTICVDNEAFRFLVAMKSGVSFSEYAIKEFANSWEKSTEDCLKLLELVVSAVPHKIKETISINHARRLIIRLSRPLAEITNNIDINIKKLKNRQDELNDTNKSIEELKEKLMIPINYLEVTKLTAPRTVCTHPSCTDAVKVSDNIQIHYKTVCHRICALVKVPQKVIGDPGLKDCWAMNSNGFCKGCDHSYLLHMHIYYHSRLTEGERIDDNVNASISRKEDFNKQVKTAISGLKQEEEKYKEEKGVIQQSMAKFAHFLKNNAIAVYNDKYTEYIEYLIDQAQAQGEHAIVKRYRKLIAAHIEQERILDSNLAAAKLQDKNAVEVSAEDVINTMEKLKNLDLSGATFEKFNDVHIDVLNHEILTSKETHFTPAIINNKTVSLLQKIGLWVVGTR